MIDQVPDSRSFRRRAFALSALISVCYIAVTYSGGFLSGTGGYWDMQIGDVGTYVTGLRFYIHDEWRFPLYFVQTMNFPDGANIVFTDSLPLLALPAKIIYKCTGLEWNYFGHWIIISNILFSVAVAALLDSLNARSLRLLAIVLCLAFAVFPYLTRTFHIALSSHFLILTGLSFYFYAQSRWTARKAFGWFLAIVTISLLVHFYLFVFTVLIAVCCFVDLYLRKKVSIKNMSLYALCALTAILAVMFCMGYFALDRNKTYSSFGMTGIYSMNILSPVTPVQSLFFRDLPYKDPTGKQFTEGMNYLGLAVIGLCVFTLIRYHGDIKKTIRLHPGLFVLCLVLLVFSFSNKIYFAQKLLLTIPLIPGIQTLYGTLQSTGRFFWINVYILTLLPPIFLWKRMGSKQVFALLLLAALVQNVETWELRQTIYKRTALSVKAPKVDRLEDMVCRHELVLISKEQVEPAGSYRKAVETLYYLAGKNGVPINYAYTARHFRQSTPLDVLIARLADTSTPILLVLPSDMPSGDLYKSFRFRLDQKDVVLLSNHVDLSNLDAPDGCFDSLRP